MPAKKKYVLRSAFVGIRYGHIFLNFAYFSGLDMAQSDFICNLLELGNPLVVGKLFSQILNLIENEDMFLGSLFFMLTYVD